MDDLSVLFSEVADALGIESVAIVEKDHYIVELLRLIQPLQFDTHQLVFAGGTALSKAGIALNRMSEDVDIKLVPLEGFFQEFSRSQRKKKRQDILKRISEKIMASSLFSFDDKYPKLSLNEYCYNELPIRYPQTYAQSPCLRPFIKLEVMETELLEAPEMRDILSLVTGLTDKGQRVDLFPCDTINSTQAEKLVSLMRRTAAGMRCLKKEWDESLVRHIYDNFCIVRERGANIPLLKRLVRECITNDVKRYGNQYPLFSNSPIKELKVGLEELNKNPVYELKYRQFVEPMVYGENRVDWEKAHACFRQTALTALGE